MSQKKLPHELSVQELLEMLESQDEDTETYTEYDSPVLSFIQAFGIVEGEELVSDIVLYELFKQWHRQGAWNKRTFNIQLGKYIPSISRNRRYYLVSETTLHLAEKAQAIVRNHTRDKRKSITWQKHFNQFIADTELEKGNKIYVEGDVLFYIYNRWLDSHDKKSRITQQKFYEVMELHFESKVHIGFSALTWFYVSRNVKNLITKEEYKRWQEGRAKKNNKKNEEDKGPGKNRTYRTRYKGKTLYQEKEFTPSGRPVSTLKKRVHNKKKSGTN